MSALSPDEPEGQAAAAAAAAASGFVLDRIVARRTKHGRLEYECAFKGRGPDENEWRSLERLRAEGHEVAALRFDQVGG